jgi:hypothetical protein
MFIERLTLVNFRCFGPTATTIDLASDFTVFVGTNGAGKTAVMQALQRLFGITGEQRRIRRQDFHIPVDESIAPIERSFVLEAVLAFPELDGEGATEAIPEFFNQMAADEAGRLKCRLRLTANFTDDGSLDGTIEQKYEAIRTFGAETESNCIELKAIDRTRIQMIYVPASRDGASQVTAFLRGRLWRAVNWSQEVRNSLSAAGTTLNNTFAGEAAVGVVGAAVQKRWQEIHTAGTDTTPLFRPVDLRFQEFIGKVEVVFHPDEAGRERALDDLSDGQRSLFHLAMTAATLDVEGRIVTDPAAAGFQPSGVSLPALTLIAVEEPENNLAPYYLARIVQQIADLTKGNRAQAVVSSHSASILTRVDPSHVRHFRLDPDNRTALVRAILLPPDTEAASKFVREAVRTFPELYFARFVVLGEGASEEVVLPRIAEAMGLDIDRSFVAVVPLGGRHVNHLWRLLTDLDIPYATLLDLDWGREGGGWGRIKTTYEQLLRTGITEARLFAPEGYPAYLAAFDSPDFAQLTVWVNSLRRFNVFFASPLDLDYSMLRAFPAAYQVAESGMRGPSSQGDPRTAVLGDHGQGALYPTDQTQALRWYRYLFLGRGKPSTHVRVLSSLTSEALSAGAPEELRVLLTSIAERIGHSPIPED